MKATGAGTDSSNCCSAVPGRSISCKCTILSIAAIRLQFSCRRRQASYAFDVGLVTAVYSEQIAQLHLLRLAPFLGVPPTLMRHRLDCVTPSALALVLEAPGVNKRSTLRKL